MFAAPSRWRITATLPKADTQFYITLAAAHRLDTDFVVFGKVISGMEVVQKLQYADRIVRVTVRGAK